jgi:hypothetical protein
MGSARSEQRLKQILAVPYGTKAKMRNAVYCERLKTIPVTAGGKCKQTLALTLKTTKKG